MKAEILCYFLLVPNKAHPQLQSYNWDGLADTLGRRRPARSHREAPPARSLLACGPKANEASAQREARGLQSRSLEQFQQLPRRHFLLLLLCSTWPRTKLVLLSACHFLSSLSSPLKQKQKENKTVSPRAADTSEMQMQAAQSQCVRTPAPRTPSDKMPSPLKSENEKRTSTSACTCRRRRAARCSGLLPAPAGTARGQDPAPGAHAHLPAMPFPAELKNTT